MKTTALWMGIFALVAFWLRSMEYLLVSAPQSIVAGAMSVDTLLIGFAMWWLAVRLLRLLHRGPA